MTLRNEILKVKELKNTYKSESFSREQDSKENFVATITKNKVNKSNKGELIGLRVKDRVNDFYHPMRKGETKLVTEYFWVFENDVK